MGNGAYYVGAGVFMLFCLAFFSVGGTIRNWVISSVLSFLWAGVPILRHLMRYCLITSRCTTSFGFLPWLWSSILFSALYGLYGLNAWMQFDKKNDLKPLKGVWGFLVHLCFYLG